MKKERTLLPCFHCNNCIRPHETQLVAVYLNAFATAFQKWHTELKSWLSHDQILGAKSQKISDQKRSPIPKIFCSMSSSWEGPLPKTPSWRVQMILFMHRSWMVIYLWVGTKLFFMRSCGTTIQPMKAEKMMRDDRVRAFNCLLGDWWTWSYVVLIDSYCRRNNTGLDYRLDSVVKQDGEEGTTATQVHWAHLTLLWPLGRWRFPTRVVFEINNPLATKAGDAGNVCPRPLTLNWTGFHFVRSLTLRALRAPRQVEPCLLRAFVQDVPFTDAVLQTRQPNVKWDFAAIITRPVKESHISLWVNASMLLLFAGSHHTHVQPSLRWIDGAELCKLPGADTGIAVKKPGCSAFKRAL